MWIVSTVAAGLFFLSTNAAHDLLGVLPLFYADCEKPLAQTVTLLKTRCNGCICTDPVFSEQYAEQSCLGNTVCLLKPWTVFSPVTHPKSLHAGCSPLTVCSSALTLWQTHRVTFGHPSTTSWVQLAPQWAGQGLPDTASREPRTCSEPRFVLCSTNPNSVTASSSLWLPLLLFLGPSTMSSDSLAMHPADLQRSHGKHTDTGLTGHTSLCPTSLSPYLNLSSTAIMLYHRPPLLAV